MAATLASILSSAEQQLLDTTNLIFSDNLITEGIRSALTEISQVHGATLTLSGLDGAAATSLPDLDAQVLVMGAVAYTIRFRVMSRFEEATPEFQQPEKIAQWATEAMDKFQAELYQVKMRLFQNSVDHPYSQWEWDEGDSF
jgi:hypothetical protein